MKLPEKIGRYEIEGLLGQGAMGSVFLGRDPSLDRRVAIKTVKDLDLGDSAKQRFLERFRNEARAAARLSHPSIVQVFDVGESEELGPYLVFEYVKGRSLKQIVRDRGALPPTEIVAIAHQLGEAIDVAHAAGIIHRDVKPDNVLVGEDGRAKLADFGVARVPDAALTKEGQFLGTPCYSAPETLSDGRYGPRTDQFSFAAVLFELVTGERAFPGDDAIAVAHSVLHDTPERPSDVAQGPIPSGVDDVILRGLAKDDGVRFTSASELAHALEHAYVLAGSVPTPSGSRRLPAVQVAPSSSRAGWIAVAMLGVLGLGGLVALASGDGLAGWSLGAVELDAAVDVPDARVVGRRGRDAGRDHDEPELTAPDAALDEPDAFEPPDAAAPLSRQELEDLAKDELDDARSAIERGDRAAAERHLARARELDPASGDLDEVRAALDALP